MHASYFVEGKTVPASPYSALLIEHLYKGYSYSALLIQHLYKGYATKHPVKNQFTPVHLWESFGLTQVYIFCDGTLQVFILSVNLPNEVC